MARYKKLSAVVRRVASETPAAFTAEHQWRVGYIGRVICDCHGYLGNVANRDGEQLLVAPILCRLCGKNAVQVGVLGGRCVLHRE